MKKLTMMSLIEINKLKKGELLTVHHKFLSPKIIERQNHTLAMHKSSWRYEEKSMDVEVLSNTKIALTVKTAVNEKLVFKKEDFKEDGTMGIDSTFYRCFEKIAI